MNMLRKFDNSEKTSEILNTPNALTAVRLFGGPALGILMGMKEISPINALALIAILGATDAEGNLIRLSERFPKIQNKLRIHASELGTKLDPIADKALVVSTLIGGAIGGDISPAVAIGIGTTEALTSGVTIAAEAKGSNPSVSNIGKLGMIGRVMTIGSNLIGSSIPPEAHPLGHEIANSTTSFGLAVTVALGSYSCYKLVKENLIKN